jgi:cytoskeleton protein RodZ
MSETDEIQSESGLTKGPEEPVESTLGLGATLRAEREKRGMSLDQVVSVTKLRKQMIDALENEEWGKLPPPVFVRGFIRTYAKVLGVDEKNLLGLYERLMPEKEEPVVPLAPPQRSRKGWYLVAVLAVVLLGIVLLLWRQHAPSPRKRALPPTEAALGSTPKKENVPKEAQPEKKVEIPGKAVVREGAAATQGNALPTTQGNALPTTQGNALPTTQGNALPTTQGNASQTTPFPSAEHTTEGGSQTKVGLKNAQEQPKAEVSGVQSIAVPAPEQGKDVYVLKAVAAETTWVRISVDDGEPKEYLLDPGSRIQWKAQKGFALLIGNAGGIELDLNGQKFDKLGKQGQVIRLNLPKGYTPTRGVG